MNKELLKEITFKKQQLDKFSQEKRYIQAIDTASQICELLERVYRKYHPDYTYSLTRLAGLYYDKGDYLKAEPLYQRALEIRKNVLGENHPRYATSLNNLALLYNDKGEYSKAEPLYQRALEIRRQVLGETRKALGENHPDYATSLNDLGVLFATTKRYTEAFQFLHEGSCIEDKQIDEFFSIASDRQRMSFLKMIERKYFIFLSLGVQYFSEDQTKLQTVYDLVLKRKSLGVEALAVQREAVLSGKYPGSGMKQIELDKLKTQIGLKKMAGPIEGEIFDKYNQELAKLVSDKEKLETELAQNILELRVEQNLKIANCKIIADQLHEGDTIIEFVRFNNKNFCAIQAKGDLRWNTPHYLALILHSMQSDNIRMIDLGDAEDIDKMVTNFRISIITDTIDRSLADTRDLLAVTAESSSRSENIWIDIGYELYKLIFYPLLPAIGGCKRLFIAPDADLARLPFEVLPTDENGKLVIDKFSIIYITTGRDILRMRKQSNELHNNAVVAADPDFDLSNYSTDGAIKVPIEANNTPLISTEATPRQIGRQSRDLNRDALHFDRLLGTENEGIDIAKLLKVQSLMEEKVLESVIKSFRSPMILHIATHGFFLPNQAYDLNEEKDSKIETAIMKGDNTFNRLSGQKLEDPMLRSGLAFAGANRWLNREKLPKEAEDGILTAEDVTTMDLSNTELVVLSACETGLGYILRGEGVFGLRRAFVVAGAQTLVMSLWKVPDEQTKELMIDFYNRMLSDQKPRAEALREAQLAMKTKPEYSHPKYWGAFICQGNPDDL